MSGGAGKGLSMAQYVELLAQRRPDVVTLAECLSLAAGVERAMLRRTRLRFLPRSTAGVEAELWFSPLVEAAGDHTLLFDPEAAEILRRRLIRHPRPHVEDVRRFTVESHQDARPVTRWFEDMLWADLLPSAAADQHVRSELARVLRALTTGGDSADDLGRWILHYLPRLPAGVRRYDDAWRIQVASSERLGLEPPDDPFVRPPSVITEARALVQRHLSVGVTARSDGVEFSSPPTDGSRLITAPGLRRIRLDVVSVLAAEPDPVRVQLRENQAVRLPMTVLQFLDGDGATTMSVAHAGVASDVVVARSVGSAAYDASCAVLLADGRIALHGRGGVMTGQVPAASPERRRRSLTLSLDGRVLAWAEDGTAVVRDLRTGQERLVSGTSARGELVRVFFTGDAAELARVYAGENRVSVVAGRSTSVVTHGESMGDRLWSSDDAACVASIGLSGTLWIQYGDERDDESTSEALSEGVTAVSGAPDGRIVVWATGDGTVWYRMRANRAGSGVAGSAPWQVTGLAAAHDGRAVAAVGGDSRLLVWQLRGTPTPPRTVALRFCADRVHALSGGGWAVSGTGGPVEVRTEDGRRYHVTPDTQDPLSADEVPAWARGRVLAEVRETPGAGFPELADGMADISAQGVDCLLVRRAVGHPGGEGVPTRGGDRFDGGFQAMLLAAQRHGMRVVVEVEADTELEDIAVHGHSGGLLEDVREWLDRDVDGVCLAHEGDLGDGVLSDVRHLLDGYGDRLLMRMRTTAAPADAVVDFGGRSGGDIGCHVVVPRWDDLLVRGVREGDLGAVRWGRDRSYAADLTSALGLLVSACPGAQWGHTVPERLTVAQRTFAASVLLSLPGCPVLPSSLFQQSALATMARLRRDHLVLSRGTCEVADLGLPGVLALLRRYGDETVLCLANSGQREVRVHIRLDHLVAEENVLPLDLLDLLDGTTVPCSQGSPAVLALEPYGVRWWRLMPAARTSNTGE